MVKENENTQHSETTEDTQKGGKPSPEEPEPQYNFKGQSTRSQDWFDLDPDWIEDNFLTGEPGFSK